MLWRRLAAAHPPRRCLHLSPRWAHTQNIIHVDNATFYRRYPSPTDTTDSNPPFFADLTFALPAGQKTEPEYWSVLSPSSLARTTFLQILAAQHICIPPTARTYPYLSQLSTSPQHAIRYVGFDAERGSSVGGTNVRGAYLSARYESRREETDYSVLDYLTGNTELNALRHQQSDAEKQILDEVVDQLNLGALLKMPVANLSNGQTRRARIAKALMARPEVLLLDGPFMGLDPNTLTKMQSVLQRLAAKQSPRLVMSLRPEDGVPEWISHLVVTDESLRVLKQGPKNEFLALPPGGQDRQNPLYHIARAARQAHHMDPADTVSKDGWEQKSPALQPGEPLVEMRGVKVAYGDKVVLGDWKQYLAGEEKAGLWWTLHRGQRCGIFGPNGSGKTTMLSLITSDHPQTYSLPVKLFGRSRLPGPGEPGISLFDIQRRMGHSSPEVHAFFPKQLTVRRAIESAWADAPLAKPQLTAEADRRVDAVLRWFAQELNPTQTGRTALENLLDASPGTGLSWSEGRLDAIRKAYDDTMYDDSDLNWAEDVRFRELGFSSQRLVLFLRALVAQPDLVILDEALSGIDERVRDKALLFLSHGEKISGVQHGVAEPSVLSRLGKVSFEGLSPKQALLVISHSKEDVPGCLRDWICLPDPGEGKPARSGTLPGPLELNPRGWDEIWGKL